MILPPNGAGPADNVEVLPLGGLEDWPLWRSARLAALTDAPEAFPDAAATWLKGGEEQWRQLLLHPKAVRLVACIEGAPVGLVRGVVKEDSAWLNSLWVSPHARGRGLGERLVHAVETWARPRIPVLRLAVVPDNAHAIALYRRCGFTDSAMVGDPLVDGTNELVMEKELRGSSCAQPSG